MRLRFSLRLVFVVVTLSAIANYCFVTRPTELAKRFVAAAERGDFETFNNLLRESDWQIHRSASMLTDRVGPIDRVYVEIFPREWSDWWSCRRRLILRTARHTDENGRHVEWSEDDEIVASVAGLKLVAPKIDW